MYNEEALFKFYNEIKTDKGARYKSWEHCYNYFNNNRKNPDLDILCLHLAFYLASWGMYRGSSFLLQKDYLVHMPVVKILLNDKYNKLWGCTVNELLEDDIINLVLEVKDKIIEAYKMQINCKIATDTLITKIMMGTFGCVPAYDRYFIVGVKLENTAISRFNKESIKQLANFYIKNEKKLEITRLKINENGIEYPQMKILDMYFWQIGFDLDKKKLNK